MRFFSLFFIGLVVISALIGIGEANHEEGRKKVSSLMRFIKIVPDRGLGRSGVTEEYPRPVFDSIAYQSGVDVLYQQN